MNDYNYCLQLIRNNNGSNVNNNSNNNNKNNNNNNKKNRNNNNNSQATLMKDTIHPDKSINVSLGKEMKK
jgi:hypothetical protein